jgi:uncharacterized protein
VREIPREQVLKRIQAENVWWDEPHRIYEPYLSFRHRAYFKLFFPLVSDLSVNRAVLLMGPRRVGKTVLIHHAIQALLERQVDPRRICYLAVDHPIYTGCRLDQLVELYSQAADVPLTGGPTYIFFDEIQYLKGWEVHLKVLVDGYPNVRFTASGSAAAALRFKSHESGAGRFTDFLLPPLTFHEYLELLDKGDLVNSGPEGAITADIDALNTRFIHYLNFGGYPEVLFSDTIQSDPSRFIKSDIIDKVLLRDLPGLYGIQDIQELNYLFTTLAFNTANEVSLEQLSQHSGVAKNTIKRYIEYLEAAFLIKVVHRISRSGKRFLRANFFKVYLTNPSMRSALFAPISEEDESIGHLAETGIFAQWFHDDALLHYARWDGGEVDIVYFGPQQKPLWAVEVKWSDRYPDEPHSLKSLLAFCRENKLYNVTVTTRRRSVSRIVDGIKIEFLPASLYCYTVGRNVVEVGKTLRYGTPEAVKALLGR